ncbi:MULTISPECIES: response regulator [Actinoplanes]|uniref:response regulator n=1 Tax=Actinoplanes TaxID=1865 RepID=UPI0005F2D37C|nr:MULTISPECIES: response regulator [Actinoplanes]GLY07149.1 hypothetical protein Acsp01_75280 [Actinoplanes sp. NBRC 101535]
MFHDRLGANGAHLSGRRPVVLLVEKDPEMRRLTAQVLEAHGIDVLAADNPAAATMAEMLHHGPIDVLLTDLDMPGVSGGELASSFTAHRPEMRVAYISEMPREIALRRHHLAPDCPFLAKPWTPALLISTLRGVFPAESHILA